MTIGSLFSGIGGLELGLEWAGLGPTLWQVEIDPKARLVLAEHWPEAVRYDDVRAVGAATLAPVDLICGGFPCQDVSSAGKRAGLDGARSGLWREFRRVVADLRPRWVVVENVTSGADLWLDAVSGSLGELGYACLPIPLAARDVGAPHRRERIFIVAAHADTSREHAVAEHAEVASAPSALAYAAGLEREAVPARVAPRPSYSWEAEPDVGRVADGVPARVDRLRLLGNAVVPQCAEVVGWVIRELAGLEAA